MNKTDKITFKLDGEKIIVERFSMAMDNFVNFIDEISVEISKKRKPFFWFITVSEGSICLNLIPEVKKEEDIPKMPQILESIKTGIKTLNESEERPSNYSDNALKALRNLASIIEIEERGINRISVSVNGKKEELTTKIIGNIDAILKTPKDEIGSIEGKLHVISDRGGYHFMIYDSLNERPVKCNFEENLLNKILSAFGKQVNVFGLIKYKEFGIPQSIQIENIQIFPEQEKLPKAKDIRGILGG